ncbi:hypothetical protein SAMN05216428_10591 [Nitrosospira sp. Nsp11]|uniref:hypothetical protein n=1 Tax=Nitrosospira sp. Nsp11 TaxID=1855338 RepID=UPI00091B12BB|nr:hypothetical protein [Nitrosospira sp. Nsp11]SHL71152.1 hypothetical protein SAMN05216428_10591 [Nitrosospira sp. Nsp11]
MTILTWLVYGLTMGGIFALVTIYAEYKADVTEEMEVIFAITLFAMIGLLFAVVKEWNRLLLKEKRNVDRLLNARRTLSWSGKPTMAL